MTTLTFIVPVRHQDNASDWNKLCSNLGQTARSIAGQRAAGWRAVVVANEGADLPPLPPGFEVERVTFPPNNMHDLSQGPREAVLDAFRFDKGRRVLSGMLRARDSAFFMVVDDDDLVSAELTGFVVRNPGGQGWAVTRGYVWNDDGSIFLEHDDFNHICGSSLIIAGGLFELPDRFEDADPDFIKARLGSHYGVATILEEAGTPLAPLPFRGAAYRVANPGSHSKTPGLFEKYVFTRSNLRRPHRLLKALFRLRLINRSLRREFFGKQD